MVKIRLRRMGKKRYPIYKIVATDVRNKRDGQFLEDLGQYNPNTDPQTVTVSEELVNKWLDYGAQPTDTVRSILSKEGITLKRALRKRGFDEAEVAARFAKWQSEKAARANKVTKTKKTESTAEATGATSEESN